MVTFRGAEMARARGASESKIGGECSLQSVGSEEIRLLLYEYETQLW